MSVFLFHGFVVKLLGKANFFRFSPTVDLVLAAMIAVAVFLLFGNPLVSKAFKKIF